MIGSLNGSSVDTTPRENGKLGGSAWAAIGTGSDNIAIGPQVLCPASVDRTLRISYEVRGRYSTTGDILVVGQANVTIPAGQDPVVTEDVRTFDNARVVLYAGADLIRIEVTQHVSEDWEFQTRIAYDLLVPA